MDINQILLIIIVILASLIIIFVIYFLLHFLFNLKREKKRATIFDPSKLVEEESLMNALDEKKNLEYHNTVDKERFLNNTEDVKVVTNEALTHEQKVNPFGIDMSNANQPNENQNYIDSNNKNKFIN